MWLILLQGLACDPAPDPPTGSHGHRRDSADTLTDSDPTTDSGTTAVAEDFTLHPPVPCDDPTDGVHYSEVGEALGLAAGPDAEGDHSDGGGLAVWDFDDDGDLDIALTYARSALYLHTWDGTAFLVDEVLVDQSGQLSLGDLNSDGRLDLMMAGVTPTAWLVGDEGWTAQSFDVDLSGEGLSMVRRLSPADLDGDGHLDLFVTRTGTSRGAEDKRDFLLWGDGDGTFVEDQEALEEVPASRAAFDAVIFDADGDHRPDVYVVNDKGPQFGPNVLWHNDGGSLGDVSADCSCDITQSGMGGDVGDFDGDGLPDLYMTASENNVLLQALPDQTWLDVTQTTAADAPHASTAMGWGAVWLDHDNDGWLDLLVASGDLWLDTGDGFWDELPISLLRQSEGAFEDISADHGLMTEGSWRATVAADHNGDGVLDLLVTEVNERPRFYLSQGCTADGWLAVEAPLHSRVEIDAGGRTRTSWVQTDRGFAAAGPAEVWFGLGEETQVDAVRVTLPWTGETYALAGPIEGRRRITLRPL